MTDNWLQVYLVESVRRDLCTQIGCTTCGAREFRLGILGAWATATGRPRRQDFDQDAVKEVAMALADVHPTPTDPSKHEDAVRCILFDLWSGLPILDNDIETTLSGSWCGNLLRAMREHHESRQSERRAFEEYNDPPNVQKRKAEKKRLKQEHHQQRLALKKERDRIWREKQGSDKA